MFFFKRKQDSRNPPGEQASKRQHKRILYDYPVYMIVGQKHFQRHSKTLSPGGLYVATSFDLPVDTLVHLRIGTENRYRFIDASGCVLYNHSGLGMGIKFVHLSPEDKRKIQTIIEKSWSQEV